ncbi:hypothetical protein [Limimaricola cinnabarinus]|uniref:hypothetical protein n=1 Tax=Limimaricola cinnabarinus TaxID=1125964 RepID=UPI002FE21EBB
MSDTTPPSLAERLEQRAANHPVPPRASCLQEIITARGTLRRLRDQGYSSAQLAAWLGECGVPVRAGTVRAYLARIDRAEKALEARNPTTEPSDREILTECRRAFVRDAAASRAPASPKLGAHRPSVATPAVSRDPIGALNHNPHRDL